MNPDPAAAAPPARRARRPMAWWLLAPVFAVGLLIGGLIVGLLAHRSPDVAAISTTVTVTPPTTQRSAEILIDPACVDTLTAAQGLLGEVGNIRDAVQAAVTTFDLSPVNALINRIEAAQATLRAAAANCHVQVRLPDGALLPTTLPGLGAAPTS